MDRIIEVSEEDIVQQEEQVSKEGKIRNLLKGTNSEALVMKILPVAILMLKAGEVHTSCRIQGNEAYQFYNDKKRYVLLRLF